MSCGCNSHNGLLTAKGLLEVEEAHRRFSLEGLSPRGGVDTGEVCSYLDKVGSVSALVEPPEPIFDFGLIDEQFRRIHNGS